MKTTCFNFLLQILTMWNTLFKLLFKPVNLGIIIFRDFNRIVWQDNKERLVRFVIESNKYSEHLFHAHKGTLLSDDVNTSNQIKHGLKKEKFKNFVKDACSYRAAK